MNHFRALLGALAIATLSTGCTGGSATDDCNDGADNDSDGLVDSADPGCAANGDAESPDPYDSACSDGEDNDGDGLIDTNDPGCRDLRDDDEFNEPMAGCKDGIDNDGDGLTDFPNDPGCRLTIQDSEEDDCPDGDTCPACSNGIDDDDDGLIDYPAELGCNSAADNDEFNADPTLCGANVSLQPLPSDGTVIGNFDGTKTNELISASCGGGGQESVYVLKLTEPRGLELTTDFPETTLDTVLYVRSDCRLPATELGCNDDAGQGNASTLLIERLDPGTYYLVVDSQLGSVGDFHLQVSEFVPEGEACTEGVDACFEGLLCRKLTSGAAGTTCEKPECEDGLDNDGDGHIDYPEEPGCQDRADNDELDDCPGGANCPQCANDSDDDDDLLVDYPDDPGCIAASDPIEIDECIPGVDVLPLDGAGVTGTTSGSSNFSPSCSFSTTSPEDVYAFLLKRNVLSLTFSTEGSSLDTVLSVRLDDCGSAAAELACEDPGTGGESVTLPAPTLGTYFVFVDGSFGSGDYVLNVEGVIPGGDPCTPGEAGYVCESGFSCVVDTCVVAACNDGIDNDGDGLVDYPNDPGCADLSDGDESDDCPGGAMCPACGNGIDDDGDGLIDLAGGDPGCSSAADTIELDECTPGVQLQELPDTGATGTTPPSGAGSDFTPSCHSSTLSTEDEYAYQNTRNLTSLTFSTVGSSGDTVLSVRQGVCGDSNSELACANDSPAGESVTVANPSTGSYFVFVDGDFSSGISYVLNVSGTVGAGATCDPAATQFTCEAGYLCGPGSTCVATQCNDGIDNSDGDGLVDFPADPGCIDLSDNDESDDCPSGAGCPACKNGVDDDGDGLIDFPADPGCAAASEASEIDDCLPGVPLAALPETGAMGTTPPSGAGSDFTPSCHTSTLSTEDEYVYVNTRNLKSLEFSTEGSSGDTVLSARVGTCGNASSEVACANDSPAGESISIANPLLGSYFVFVDGDFTSGISYVLNVSGILDDGETCDAANTQFVCDQAAGIACVGGVCATGECSDGADNDGDGLIDAADPGCDSLGDSSEAPDPSPLPACADGIDNDADTFIDFPDDPQCDMASDNQE